MRPRRRGNAKEWRELGLTIKKDAIGFPSEETIAWISTSLPRFGGDHARSVCDTLSCMANPRAGKIVEIEEASKIKSYWPFSVSFYTPYEDFLSLTCQEYPAALLRGMNWQPWGMMIT